MFDTFTRPVILQLMTQKNLTSIVMVLDRSGSMTKLTAETISGFNKFLADQKACDGEATLTLATFASDYTLVHDCVPLDSVKDLTLDNYRTGGYTALLDALCRTIDATGVKLAAMPEDKRPHKVIVAIITDGQENYSREFTSRDAVFERITHQREKYSWEFVFLGANQDAIQEGMKLGVTASNSYNFIADSAGVAGMNSVFSSNMTAYRNGTAQQVNFFDQGQGSGIKIAPPDVKVDVDIKIK